MIEVKLQNNSYFFKKLFFFYEKNQYLIRIMEEKVLDNGFWFNLRKRL